MQLFAKFFQQRHVAAALMAKNKIRADTDALHAAKIVNESANKRFRRLFAEGFVKTNFQQRIGAERFNRAQFLWLRINQRRNAIRRDDGIGMFVEGDDERDAIVLACIGDSLPDDLLMAEMDPVKHADGEADF